MAENKKQPAYTPNKGNPFVGSPNSNDKRRRRGYGQLDVQSPKVETQTPQTQRVFPDNTVDPLHKQGSTTYSPAEQADLEDFFSPQPGQQEDFFQTPPTPAETNIHDDFFSLNPSQPPQNESPSVPVPPGVGYEYSARPLLNESRPNSDYSRRRFIQQMFIGFGSTIGVTAVGGGIFAFLSNIFGKKDSRTAEPDPTKTSLQPETTSTYKPVPTVTPIPTSTASTEQNITNYREHAFENITFLIDTSDNIPKKYKTKDGRVVDLDVNIINAAIKLAEKSGEPEPAIRVSIGKPQELPFRPSTDRPEIKEIPNDVMTAEELKLKKIRIINSDNTSLYIRKSAFEPGGMLEGISNFDIVLINGTVVDPIFMKDLRYNDFVGRSSNNNKEFIPYEEYRKKKIDQFTMTLKRIKSTNKLYSQDILFAMASMKDMIRYYQNATPELLLVEQTNNASEAAGLFAPGGSYNTIFVCVGEMPTVENYGVIAYPDGQVLVSKNIIVQGSSFTPKISQNYPRLSDFRRNQNNNIYPYGAQTAGNILRHELYHLVYYKLFGNSSSSNNRNYVDYRNENVVCQVPIS
ncbi:MAG: hypothetical protein WCJ19_04040 [bacterium]